MARGTLLSPHAQGIVLTTSLGQEESIQQRSPTAKRPVRCVVYKRKSISNGLDLELNSLEVQLAAI